MAEIRNVHVARPGVRLAPSSMLKRVSWGAIFAGAFCGLAVALTLDLLGVGIGAAAIHPAQGVNLGKLGLSAGIWMIVAAMIAFFIGGWVSGRLAGNPLKSVGSLHGFVMWGLATVAVAVMLGGLSTTMIQGATQGATTGIASAAANGQNVASSLKQSAESAKNSISNSGNSSQSNSQNPNSANSQPQNSQVINPGANPNYNNQPAMNNGSNQYNGTDTSQLNNPNSDQGVSGVGSPGSQQQAQNNGATSGGSDQQSQNGDNSQQQASSDQTAKKAVSTASLGMFALLILTCICSIIGGLVGSPSHLLSAAEAGPVVTDEPPIRRVA